MEEMRLQKYLALCGVASRRSAEGIITEGRVTVNGEKITELGTKVTDGDVVCVDGIEQKPEHKKLYIMLNKPTGFVTTVSDEQDRPTVMDLLGDVPARVYPVGRLDFNTEGLLLLTNDGDFTYKITHPKHKLDKTYEVLVTGKAKQNAIRMMETGLFIDGRKTAPANVGVAEAGKASALLTITIHEGRNRQVRKMCQAVGFKVLSLKRVYEGGLNLGNLPLGKWRHLSPAEVGLILKNAERGEKK